MVIDFRTDSSRYKHWKLEFASVHANRAAIERRPEQRLNENHLHSGLKWKSPRAFIRAKTETV